MNCNKIRRTFLKKGIKKTVKLPNTFLKPEEFTIEEEILDWYSMSPAERFMKSQKLWEVFLLLGGHYDQKPDTQSPFHIFEAWRHVKDKKKNS